MKRIILSALLALAGTALFATPAFADGASGSFGGSGILGIDLSGGGGSDGSPEIEGQLDIGISVDLIAETPPPAPADPPTSPSDPDAPPSSYSPPTQDAPVEDAPAQDPPASEAQPELPIFDHDFEAEGSFEAHGEGHATFEHDGAKSDGSVSGEISGSFHGQAGFSDQAPSREDSQDSRPNPTPVTGGMLALGFSGGAALVARFLTAC